MAGRTAQDIAFEDLAGLPREHFDVPPVRVLETVARGELTPDPPELLKMSAAVEERTGRELGNRADDLSATTTVRALNAAAHVV